VGKPVKHFKKIASAIGSCVGGLIAGVGTSINIPALGGAILTGAFPFIAALGVGLLIWYGLAESLKDIALIHYEPCEWRVMVYA
jgi:hypothetical protein